MLVDLLIRLANTHPDIRRECFDYLKKHAALSPGQQKQSEGERLLALWAELAPDLDELYDDGGGYCGMVDQVASLLYQIEQTLSREKIEASYRHELLDNVLPYIERGNAGLHNNLLSVLRKEDLCLVYGNNFPWISQDSHTDTWTINPLLGFSVVAMMLAWADYLLF